MVTGVVVSVRKLPKIKTTKVASKHYKVMAKRAALRQGGKDDPVDDDDDVQVNADVYLLPPCAHNSSGCANVQLKPRRDIQAAVSALAPCQEDHPSDSL